VKDMLLVLGNADRSKGRKESRIEVEEGVE
jgi:hypothetical protein